SPAEATERIAGVKSRLAEIRIHATRSVMGSNVYVHFQPRRVWRMTGTSSLFLWLSLSVYAYAARRLPLDQFIPNVTYFAGSLSSILPKLCLAVLLVSIVTIVIGLQLTQHRVIATLAADPAKKIVAKEI
ncbi:MAG: hypothetical protein ACREO5_14135, partial [Candidatus Binatia bacterium]